jgi:hypothetical protein
VKRKIVFEDMTMQFNKWTQGISSREMSAQRLSLRDLFDKTMSTSQYPNDTKVPKTLPFPISNVLNELSSLYVNAANSKRLFEQAMQYPLINKREKAKTSVNTIISKLDNIIDEIKQISDSLENIVD